VLHQAGFSVSLVVGTLLIVGADGGRRRAAAAVFAGSVAACFGASALYHRVTWTPRLRRWMRRIDHAGVYLLIAGTYTPVCLLVLGGAWRMVVLVLVCVGAGAAIVLEFAWVGAPKWGRGSARYGAGLGGGCDAAAACDAAQSGGGLAYTTGAIIYARRQPNLFHPCSVTTSSFMR
jgi:hemolysin III